MQIIRNPEIEKMIAAYSVFTGIVCGGGFILFNGMLSRIKWLLTALLKINGQAICEANQRALKARQRKDKVMEILRVENLRKVYGAGETKVSALDHVSFSVEKGEFVSIVGQS